MTQSKIWLVLGVISTLSIASIAWNYNDKHRLFKLCMGTTGMEAYNYGWSGGDKDKIDKASAYGYSRCMGGRHRDL
jgi:hypothetical protein